MKTLITRFNLFLLILLIGSGSLAAGKDVPAPGLKEKIDHYLAGIYKPNMPGAAVLVAKKGEVILRKGYGMADMELGVPVKPEMVFRIGSITKQFTAAGIMMLVERGKVNLDDLMTVYLPDYPLKGKKVTVRHLLNHTSGIKSYTSMQSFGKLMRKDMSVDELIDVFKNEPFDFEPGEKYRYNNSGYILLGAIIEKVSGQKYAEFIRENIFKKAGMDHSYYDDTATIIKNRARGYSIMKNGVNNASYISMTLPYAAGSLMSTVDDLYKWNRALFGGNLISKKSLKQMVTRSKLNSGEEISYAFGLIHIDYEGFTEILHGGGINGFITQKSYFPEKDIFVTVLTNSTGHKYSPLFVSQWIGTLMLGKPYSEDKVKILSGEALDEYVGIYRISKDEERTVFREGNKLFTQRTGGPRQEAFSKGVDTFFFKKSFTWFTFERDKKDGRVMAMTMHSLSGKDYARKTDKKAEIKKAVKIDTAVYKKLTGRYQMQGFEMVVSSKEGKLFVQATGQDAAEMFPKSSLRYFLKVVDAEIEFTRDPEGNITGLVLYQGKVKMAGKKL